MFSIINEQDFRIPILISCPHAGLENPHPVSTKLRPPYNEQPIDADWYVDKLYRPIAEKLGAILIVPKFSRYTVDLNRAPENIDLYSDGRFTTGLFPTHSFSKEALYLEGQEPNPKEQSERLEKYYLPYHQSLAKLLQKLKAKFPSVLLFEAHSIRKHVPAITLVPVPDLVLGTNDSQSCKPSLEALAKQFLISTDYDFSLNHPFKGGYITRHYANPKNGIHCMQLELCQELYMDVESLAWDNAKATQLQTTLETLLDNLSQHLKESR